MIFIIFLILISSVISDAAYGAAREMKNLLGEKTIQINTTQDSVLELSNHWIDQALSALIATVANEK